MLIADKLFLNEEDIFKCKDDYVHMTVRELNDIMRQCHDKGFTNGATYVINSYRKLIDIPAFLNFVKRDIADFDDEECLCGER